VTRISRGARLCGLTIAAAVLSTAGAARAQGLPSEPITFAAGRVTVGGDIAVTFSCAATADSGCGEDTGFFNYSDYNHSSLRELRFDVNTVVRASRRVALLAEVRTLNASGPEPYALYLRVRPWDGNFDVQFGRIPPTFGSFARHAYPNDNPLIGYPLGYQYLLSLRPDAVPSGPAELLRMRGRGWLSSFSVGDPTPDTGLAIASASHWDTGLQVHAGLPWIEGSAAVTTGSLSHPLVIDDNSGKQTAGRVVLRPVAGLVVGASAARGPFLARSTTTAAGSESNSPFTQSAWGADLEFSRDYYLIRMETIHSTWRLPTIGTPLDASATFIEGRYKILPGLHVAARLDRLNFSELEGAGGVQTWEAPVSRIEVGGGYLLRRNLQLKGSFQRNVRDGGRVRELNLTACQLVFWL
jgi:hypothetical protein